jgi:heme oxygenase
MSLKDLTSEKHRQAESTKFMKSVFDGTLAHETWIDYTYQKTLFYNTIEYAAEANGLLQGMTDIRRISKLYKDYFDMNVNATPHDYRPVTLEYHKYLLDINTYPDRVLAHLYTWHMGDMFGGQMIKRVIPGKHSSFDFENKDQLITTLRSKINDSMADEANTAFDWAIKILEQYDN